MGKWEDSALWRVARGVACALVCGCLGLHGSLAWGNAPGAGPLPPLGRQAGTITPAEVSLVSCTASAAFAGHDDCVGQVTDPKNDVGASPTLLDYLNQSIPGHSITHAGSGAPWGSPGEWVGLTQIEDGGGARDDGRVRFTSSCYGGCASRTGTFTIETNDGSLLGDVVISVKDGAGWSAYLFEALGVSSFTADWDTLGLTNGAGRPGPELSHISAYYDTRSMVPEPQPARLTLQKAVGPVAHLGGDRFAVDVILTLANVGAVAVDQVQVTDDLGGQLAPAEVVSVADLQATAGLEINPAFDGTTVVELLTGTDSLAPGDSAVIRFRVTFATGGAPGPFSNLAEAAGRNHESGELVSTCSHPAPQQPGDTAPCEPTMIELPEVPSVVGLAKRAAPPEALSDGRFRARITFVARNYGVATAQDVQIFDDLSAVFGESVAFEVESLTSPTWPVDPGFDGIVRTGLLAPGAALGLDQTGTVELSLLFRPGPDTGALYNTACAASGDGPCDASTDGSDPDPNGDGDPAEAQPTVIYEPPPPTPTALVGIASAASPSRYPGGRTVVADLTVYLRNMGTVPLTEVRVENDLAATFGDAVETFAVVPGSLTSDTLAVNGGFDGVGERDLLAAGAGLGVGAEADVTFSVSFVPIADEGFFLNQSMAATGEGATDLSTDGVEPDPDANGVPDEGTPTRIDYRLPGEPAIGLAKDASPATALGSGSFEVSFTLYLANTGAVPLTGLDLTDDLSQTFPAPATFQVVSGTLESDRFTVNAAFDGAGDLHLLAAGNDLAPGEAGQVSVTVRFQPNGSAGPFFNQASVTSAEGAGDTSNDGPDPDAEGDDETEIPLPTNPLIGIAKAVTAVTVEPDTADEPAYLVGFRIVVANSGDVPLGNVQVMDDLSLTFPAPATFTVPAAPVVGGALSEANAGFGHGSFALLSGAESLAVGAAATIDFTVRLVPNDGTDEFFNEALASAVDPDGQPVFDRSTAGLEPDPDGEKDKTPVRLPGAVQGTVFLDRNHDRLLNAGDATTEGWTVELLDQNEDVLRTTVSAAGGAYSVADIPEGAYAVQFRHPETHVTWGRTAIEIVPRGLAMVDLPIDPQGLVYDSATRSVVPGVVLSILDSSGEPLPAECLLPDQQAQATGSDGAYLFTILHARCPLAVTGYRLEIGEVPDGYAAGFSTDIPPDAAIFDTETCAAPCLIQAQNGPPGAGDDTVYHTTFSTSASAATVINNHLPIDQTEPPPGTDGERPPALTIDLSANRRRASVGGVVGYTATLENRSDQPLSGVELSDQPAPAFQLQTDSALLVRAGPDGMLGTADDVREPLPASAGQTVAFAPVDIAPFERLQVRFVSRVSTAARPGLHFDKARADYTSLGVGYAVTDTATVEVAADPLFTRATVIGKVFHDVDGDGTPDPGEPGMYKARLITPEGLIVETDAQGRFHIADIDVTRGYGANYVVKLDANTLPDGWYSRSDPRRVVHLAEGGIAKINIAVGPGPRAREFRSSDCCGEFQNFRYIDPFATGKRLDLYPATLTVADQVWSLEFSISSNYYVQAPYYELAIYAPDDVAFTKPLKTQCGVLHYPQQFVGIGGVDPGGYDRLVYLLRVFERSDQPIPPDPALDCRTLDTSTAGNLLRYPLRYDITHALEIHLPGSAESGSWPAGRSISPGSALAAEGVLVNRAVRAQALRRYLDGTDEERERLTSDNVRLEEDFRGNRLWLVQPKVNPGEPGFDNPLDNADDPARPLPPGIDMEVKFDAVPETVGRSWLDRDTLFQPYRIVYGAEHMETTMECCDVKTSVEPLTDQNNSVYAIRVRNDSRSPITPHISSKGFACGDIASRPIQPLGTREYYLGGFQEFGPDAEDCWSEIDVWISTPELPPETRIAYKIVRQRFEEDGHWRPPRTTAYCLQVEATPQLRENREVAAIRLRDSDDTREASTATGAISTDTNFGVGVIDLTLGGRSASGGLDDLVDELGEDGMFADGRIAAYWRGIRRRGDDADLRWVLQLDSTKDELDNLFDNLKREDPNRIFRQLDPDRYYPTYGDDSTTTLETATQGAFYARVESNRSHALWGNYNTGLTGTEFAQYNRSLYGAYGDYQSEALTGAGESRWQLTAFGSEAQTASGHAAFLATGGSLYYLPHTDVVMGSEKVWVEVRRRDTEQVEEREILLPGRDYEFDPLQGRILLQSPLAQVLRERHGNVIRSRPLEGDDVMLLVDYEYLTAGFEADDYVYGVRGRAWLDERFAVGATHVTDEQGLTDYTLNGLDLLWRYGRDSYLSAELARSESARGGASAFSLDGGLTFEDDPWAGLIGSDRSDALGLEARINLDDLDAGSGLVRAWWKARDAGFSSGRFSPGPETTDLGVDFDTTLGDRWSLNGGATELDRKGDRTSRTARLQATGRWRCGSGPGQRGCTELGLEGRYEDLDIAAADPAPLPWSQADGSATLVGGRLGYWLNDATTVYASAQTAIGTRRDYEDNDAVAVGTNTRFSDSLAVSLEASDGDRGNAVIAGVDYRHNERASFNLSGGVGSGALSRFTGRYQLSEGHELFGTYTMDPDRTDGARNLLSVGQRRDLGDRMRIFTESQFGRGNREVSNGHVGGVELDRNDWVFSTTLQFSSVTRDEAKFDRTAASLGATYTSDTTRLSSRFEIRDDQGAETDSRQYVTSNALTHQLGDNGRLIGKLNLAWTDDKFANVDAGRFAEFALGYAHRPIEDDRFNGLVRYAYLYDVATLGQSEAPGDEKAHLVSAEGFYEITPRLQLGGKLAYRGGKSRVEKGSGEWHELSLGMAIARASYRLDLPGRDAGKFYLPDQLELLGEYRWLEDFEGASTRQGALLGLYRQFDPRKPRRGEPVDTTPEPGPRRLLPPSLRVGVGYNFSGFDDDLRMDSYKSHGWFVDLMAVF